MNKKADAKPAGNKKASTLKKTQLQDENCDYSDLRDAIDGELYFSLNSLLPVLLTTFCIYCYLKEDSLRHVAMEAKFLNDNKPETSLEKRIRAVSNINFDYLIQFHLICLRMAKFSGVKSERTVSKFRKRERKFWRCACLLRKAGA